MSRIHADVLVIGAGAAGLTAAARATARGATVVVVEQADSVGGSALFAGYIWTAPDHAVMDRVNPGGDPALRRELVDRFPAAVDWIRSLGIEVDDAVPILRYGSGHRFDTGRYVDECRRRVAATGTVLTGTRTTALRTRDGAVTGATVRLPDGSVHDIEAAATVLATGGFQADAALSRRHIHPAAGTMPLRSNPVSDGAGLRLAESVGAATGTPRSGFYGHLVPTGVTFRDPGDFVALSLYYSEHALLFDLSNRRFTDETLGDHLTAMALLERPQARGLLIADERVYRQWVLGSYVAGAVAVDKFELTCRRDGRSGVAADLDELAYLPDEWGYDGAAIAAEIRALNAAGARVQPGRTHDCAPLNEGPYYVVEARPALTFPFHGVRIDASGRVRAAAGGIVPGLFAAGSDIGGLYDHAYAGGIAPAVVFGLAAADASRTPSAAS